MSFFLNFLIMSSLVALPWILGSLSVLTPGLKFFKNPPLGTMFISGFISYSWFQISWWSIVLPILLSLFLVDFTTPLDEAAQERVHCQTGLIIGCIIGVIISFF